jgi:flagellar basal-body rod modification protein FlgD
MSFTSPATGTTSTTGTTTNSASSAVSNSALSDNTFLQLMTAELRDQNPLDTSNDPTQYVTQLAQFTSLEQQTNTAQSAARLATQQETTAALTMIGKTATYVNSSGSAQTGTVESVDLTSTGPTLTIGGTPGIAYSNVTEVS